MQNILILGAKGMLGQRLAKELEGPVTWDREEVDVLDFPALRDKILSLPARPSAIINCIAYNDVDGAETSPEAAFALNAEFVGKLAEFCKQVGMPLAHFSTNYVFDGEKGEYTEEDQPNPLSIYGKSKYEGERLALANTDKLYLIRTSVIFGPKGESAVSKRSFVELMLDMAAKTDTIKAIDDEINSVTLVTDLARAVKFLVTEKKPYGIYHVANVGAASWYDLAKEIFFVLKKKINIIPVPSSEFPRMARRPKKSVLINTKLYALQPWPEAVKEFLVREFISKPKA